MVSPLAKTKCTFCGNIFMMADGMENSDFQTTIDAHGKNAPEEVLAEAQSSKKAVDAILEDGDLYDVDRKEKTRKKTGAVVWAMLVVFLLLVAGGAVYFFDPLGWRSAPGDEAKTSGEQPPPPSGQASENVITDPTALASITLLDVKQYYVNNDKLGGQLFIIEGNVVNNFPTPVSLIRVEATLLDEDKNIIVANQQFCGISVSYFQLQVLTEKELTEALSNKLEVLSKNTNVQPGARVPFIFVFRSVPPSVRAFGVRVIEAQKAENTETAQ